MEPKNNDAGPSGEVEGEDLDSDLSGKDPGRF
jgi:hypothetical protein